MATSTTILTDEQVSQIAEKFGIAAWTKMGAPRYYLNLDALAEIIGLDQSFYNSGHCSGCSYVDIQGDEVSVAHSRAYGDGGYMGNKTYICDGRVHCTWEPYDENIAELIAVRIAEILGTDPDEGEAEEKWGVIPSSKLYMSYYFVAESEANERCEELSAKFPDRSYEVHRVRIGGRTGRMTIIQ